MRQLVQTVGCMFGPNVKLIRDRFLDTEFPTETTIALPNAVHTECFHKRCVKRIWLNFEILTLNVKTFCVMMHGILTVLVVDKSRVQLLCWQKYASTVTCIDHSGYGGLNKP